MDRASDRVLCCWWAGGAVQSELKEKLDEAMRRDDVKAIVLTGNFLGLQILVSRLCFVAAPLSISSLCLCGLAERLIRRSKRRKGENFAKFLRKKASDNKACWGSV